VQKSRLLRVLLNKNQYDKDAEPPSAYTDDVNTTVTFGLTVTCATPIGDFVSIESWTSMVRAELAGVYVGLLTEVKVIIGDRRQNRRIPHGLFVGSTSCY